MFRVSFNILTSATMSTKRFYLLGDSPATGQEIEVPVGIDERELQHLVATHFAIVDPDGEF